MIVIPIVLSVIALFLLVTGLRGRKINEHPYCRACGFDLYGLQDSATVCPECGANLTQKSSKRIGKRQWMPKRFTIGLTVLLPAIFLAGLCGLLGGKASWNKFKPVFWLMQDMESDDFWAAANEIERRIAGGKLSADSMSQVLERAIDLQVNAFENGDIPVDSQEINKLERWCSFIHTARKNGRVSAEYLQRFLEEVAYSRIQFRSHLTEGSPMVLQFGSKNFARDPDIKVMCQKITIRIGDKTHEIAFSGNRYLDFDSYHSLTHPLHYWKNYKDVLHPGSEYAVKISFDLTVQDAFSMKPLHTWRIDRQFQLKLAATGDQTVRLIKDPSRQEQVSDAIDVSELKILTNGIAELEATVKSPPYPLAFEVLIDDQKQPPWTIGQYYFPKDSSQSKFLNSSIPNGKISGTEVNVIFRPAPKLAERTIDTYEIYGEEIVIRGVKVTRE